MGLSNTLKVKGASTSYLSKWERPHSNVVAMIWHQKLWEWSLSTKLVMAKNFSLQKYRLRFYFFYYLGFPINFFLWCGKCNKHTFKNLTVLEIVSAQFFYLHK